MSNHPPHQKKQKLSINEDGVKRSEDHVDTGSYESETAPIRISAPTSAVTALALLSDTIIFSGHRDGTICRWNTTLSQQVSEDPLQEPNCRQPDWVITSACINLTNHEIYGKEEKLGIAGLVVRKNQQIQSSPTSQDISTVDTSTSSSSTIASDSSHFLYSWNHQREDMRMEINGIPQKVMIWNATTSERLSALMIDVGRCCYTKMYANPLISCLVFCKLLVNESNNQSATVSSSSKIEKNASVSNNETATIAKVWTDAVIVALQATCDAPTKNEDECMSTDTNNPDTKRTTSPLSQPPPPPKRKVATPTGNIVPFYEQTRKRMAPWMATGGFVRALAVVGAETTSTSIYDQNNSDYGYIVSVTETTTKPNIPLQHQTISETNSTDMPINAVKESEGSSITPSNDGGQVHGIILWDTASPGTILHIFSLDSDGDNRNNLYNQRFNGNVYALTLSHCNQYLLLSMYMESTSSDSRHVVLSLPSTTGIPSSNDPVNDSFILSICGWCTSSHREIAASHRGDLIASTSLRNKLNNISQQDDSIVQHFLRLYSFRDLLSSIKHRPKDDVEFDITKLPSITQIVIPTKDIEPTRIALGESHVILGYENGTTESTNVPSYMDDAANSLNSDIGSNAYVSCSTAPIGLRGVPCPHLSSSANNVNLQNKCTII